MSVDQLVSSVGAEITQAHQNTYGLIRKQVAGPGTGRGLLILVSGDKELKNALRKAPLAWHRKWRYEARKIVHKTLAVPVREEAPRGKARKPRAQTIKGTVRVTGGGSGRSTDNSFWVKVGRRGTRQDAWYAYIVHNRVLKGNFQKGQTVPATPNPYVARGIARGYPAFRAAIGKLMDDFVAWMVRQQNKPLDM